jgi:amphi-Trp domain-containing protein
VEREFQHRSVQDASTLAAYLNALIEGFEKGNLRFSDRDGQIALVPRGLIDFGIEATRKRDRAHLRLEFSWKDVEKDTDRTGPLRIDGASD